MKKSGLRILVLSLVLSAFIGPSSQLSLADGNESLKKTGYLAASSRSRAYIDTSGKYRDDVQNLVLWRAQRACIAAGFLGLATVPMLEEIPADSPASLIISDGGYFEEKILSGEKPYFYSTGKAPWHGETLQARLQECVLVSSVAAAISNPLLPTLGVVCGTVCSVAGTMVGGCQYLDRGLRSETGQAEVSKLSYKNLIKNPILIESLTKVSVVDRPATSHLVYGEAFFDSCARERSEVMDLNKRPVSEWLMKQSEKEIQAANSFEAAALE